MFCLREPWIFCHDPTTKQASENNNSRLGAERTHESKSTVGPRSLYKTFAAWIHPDLGSVYDRGVVYAIRMLGLNSQIYNEGGTRSTSNRVRELIPHQNPRPVVLLVMKNKSVRRVCVDVFLHVLDYERR